MTLFLSTELKVTSFPNCVGQGQGWHLHMNEHIWNVEYFAKNWIRLGRKCVQIAKYLAKWPNYHCFYRCNIYLLEYKHMATALHIPSLGFQYHNTSDLTSGELFFYKCLTPSPSTSSFSISWLKRSGLSTNCCFTALSTLHQWRNVSPFVQNLCAYIHQVVRKDISLENWPLCAFYSRRTKYISQFN